jgi:hypothetical protein
VVTDALALLLVLGATPAEPVNDPFAALLADHRLETAGLQLQLAKPESIPNLVPDTATRAQDLIARDPLPFTPVEAEAQPERGPQAMGVKHAKPKASVGVQLAVILIGAAAGITTGLAAGVAVDTAVTAPNPNDANQQTSGSALATIVAVPTMVVSALLVGWIATEIVAATTGESVF